MNELTYTTTTATHRVTTLRIKSVPVLEVGLTRHTLAEIDGRTLGWVQQMDDADDWTVVVLSADGLLGEYITSVETPSDGLRLLQFSGHKVK